MESDQHERVKGRLYGIGLSDASVQATRETRVAHMRHFAFFIARFEELSASTDITRAIALMLLP